MKKILVPVLAFVLAFSFGCANKASETANAKLMKATVSLVIGNVSLLRDGSASPVKVKPNMQILPADMVITGANSKMNIVLEKSGVIQIGANSKVILSSLFVNDEGATEQKLSVKAGQVILGLKKLQKDSSFNVETPTAVAGVRGTSFMVNVQNSEENNAFPFFVKLENQKNVTTKVAVLSGAVELLDGKDDGKSVMITQLKQAILEGADFENIKLMNIDRLTLDQLNELRGFAEISKLKMNDITEEINQIDPEINQMLGTSLDSKAGIKKAGTGDVTSKESLLKDGVQAKEQVIEKVKVKQKQEGKYLDDQGSW